MLDYGKIMDIYREEHSSNNLAKLPQHFYKELKKLLDEKKTQALTGDEIALEEYRRLNFLKERIIEKRLEKIFFLASKDLTSENLTEEELNLLNSLKESKQLFEKKVKEFFTEDEKEERQEEEQQTEATKEEKKDKKYVQVLITRYVEPYRGLDGNIYGPFKEGETIKMPKEEGEWLILAGFAKKKEE